MQLSDLTYITHIWELLAAVIATVNFKKFENSSENIFLYFLWFTFIVDLAGGFIGDFFGINTYWIYNIYMMISFLFFYFWYHTILEGKKQKLVVILFALIFLAISSRNLIFESWEQYHKYSFVTGALFTLICAIFHFWQLLNSDEVLEIKFKLSFWISTGLLLFNVGMIPFMLLSEYFDFSGNAYYIFIIIGLNLILYGCYSIGFLWTKAKYNRS